MSSLLAIYALPLAAGSCFAVGLSILGGHLAARDKAMQTLCIGQAATLGILFGIGLIHGVMETESSLHYSPVVIGFLFSLMAYSFGEWTVRKVTTSRNSYFAAIFVSLLAATSLLSVVLPGLENHLSQVFFGDLATLSDRDSLVMLVASLLTLAFLLIFAKKFTNGSFETAIFGYESGGARGFNLFALFVIALSVQFLGFLFTASCLFLPTTLLREGTGKELNRHFITCALIAGSSAALGFLLSLNWERLPTVPVIVAVMIVLGSLSAFVGKRVYRQT